MLASKYVVEDEYVIVVRRNHVINDAFKRMERPISDPSKKVVVSELIGV